MKAATGFEPVDGGFADLSLNHLGTPPKFCTLACSDRAFQHPLLCWVQVTESR